MTTDLLTLLSRCRSRASKPLAGSERLDLERGSPL